MSRGSWCVSKTSKKILQGSLAQGTANLFFGNNDLLSKNSESESNKTQMLQKIQFGDVRFYKNNFKTWLTQPAFKLHTEAESMPALFIGQALFTKTLFARLSRLCDGSACNFWERSDVYWSTFKRLHEISLLKKLYLYEMPATFCSWTVKLEQPIKNGCKNVNQICTTFEVPSQSLSNILLRKQNSATKFLQNKAERTSVCDGKGCANFSLMFCKTRRHRNHTATMTILRLFVQNHWILRNTKKISLYSITEY